jgi:hypothetical protein
MYDVKPNLIIGFHGCEADVRDALIQNPNDYKISQKPIDWLGHGLYFWEHNYDRALEWADEKKERGNTIHTSLAPTNGCKKSHSKGGSTYFSFNGCR